MLSRVESVLSEVYQYNVETEICLHASIVYMTNNFSRETLAGM